MRHSKTVLFFVLFRRSTMKRRDKALCEAQSSDQPARSHRASSAEERSVSDSEVESMIEKYINDHYGTNSESKVAAVEEELGLVLPRSYRIFLKKFGAAVCNGYMIAGLPDTRSTDEETPFWEHVADVTKSRWPNRAGIGVDRHFVFLTDNGGDISYYLDTSAMDEQGRVPRRRNGPRLPRGCRRLELPRFPLRARHHRRRASGRPDG